MRVIYVLDKQWLLIIVIILFFLDFGRGFGLRTTCTLLLLSLLRVLATHGLKYY